MASNFNGDSEDGSGQDNLKPPPRSKSRTKSLDELVAKLEEQNRWVYGVFRIIQCSPLCARTLKRVVRGPILVTKVSTVCCPLQTRGQFFFNWKTDNFIFICVFNAVQKWAVKSLGCWFLLLNLLLYLDIESSISAMHNLSPDQEFLHFTFIKHSMKVLIVLLNAWICSA